MKWNTVRIIRIFDSFMFQLSFIRIIKKQSFE